VASTVTRTMVLGCGEAAAAGLDMTSLNEMDEGTVSGDGTGE
jgi:hypothetical protein